MHLSDDRYEPISVDEAASRLKVSSSTVRRMIRDGKLQAERETRPQGEIVRVLWPRPEDVPPPVTPTESPPVSAPADHVSEALSAALGALTEALESERMERQRIAAENAALAERVGRAEALAEQRLADKEQSLIDLGEQMERAIRAEADAATLAAEVSRLRARRWWRFWV